MPPVSAAQRLNIGPGNLLGPETMMPLARRIAPLGWHMQLNLTPRFMPSIRT